MQGSIRRQIARTYEQRRQIAEQERDRRVDRIYAAWPELLQLDRALAAAGADLLLEAVDPARPKIAAARLSALKASRQAFISRNGLEPDFDQVRYTCPLCQDSGLREGQDSGLREGQDSGRTCSCYQAILIPLLTEQANLRHLQGISFESFDESLFSAQADAARYQSDLSPRQQIIGLRRNCERFIREFDRPETRNLLFVGKPGTGKTFLMACIARDLLAAGRSVLYLSAPQLFDLLQEHRNLLASFNPDAARLERSLSLQDGLMNCDLLLIDDLGTEAGAASRYADLLGVIDGRALPGLKTIISSNADPATLRDQYDERLLSRLVGGFAVYRFFGEDIRMQMNRRRRT